MVDVIHVVLIQFNLNIKPQVTFSITWSSPRTPLWYKLQNTKHCHDPVEIQISVSMQRPTNCKYSNYCWIQGRSTFKKWKRRYVCIIQVSYIGYFYYIFHCNKS